MVGRLSYATVVASDLSSGSDSGVDFSVAVRVFARRDNFIWDWICARAVLLAWAKFFLDAVSVSVFVTVSYRILAVVFSVGIPLGIVVY